MKLAVACFVLGTTSAVVASDRCTTDASLDGVTGIYALKTGVFTCSNSDLTCDTKSCECGTSCCTNKVGTCHANTGTYTCVAPKVYDASKGAATAATDADFKANCCSAKATCTGFSCPSGYKIKTGAITCLGAKCGKSECCDADLTTCEGMKGSTACGANRKFAGGTVTGLTTATYDTKCCTAMEQGCKSFSCPTGMVAKATNPTFYGTGKNSNCCSYSPLTCGAKQGTVSVANGCAATHFVDSTKATNAVKADDSDFKTQCCTTLIACGSTWNDYKPPKSSSSAIKQAPLWSMLFSFTAALAFGQ